MGDDGDDCGPLDTYLKTGIIPPYYKTALLSAAEKGDAPVVQGYLEVGTDPNTRDDFGRTILHIAAISGKVEVVTVAIAQKNTDKHAKDIYGRTPLQIAASVSEENDEGAQLKLGTKDDGI